MTQDPLVFGDMPLPIKVLVIAVAFVVGPYFMIRAWLESRRESAEIVEVEKR